MVIRSHNTRKPHCDETRAESSMAIWSQNTRKPQTGPRCDQPVPSLNQTLFLLSFQHHFIRRFCVVFCSKWKTSCVINFHYENKPIQICLRGSKIYRYVFVMTWLDIDFAWCSALNGNIICDRPQPPCRKSLIFRVLCALFEQIPLGTNRDILKTLPDAELKIVTNSMYLVIWSRGFPTLTTFDAYGVTTNGFALSRDKTLPVNFWLEYPAKGPFLKDVECKVVLFLHCTRWFVIWAVKSENVPLDKCAVWRFISAIAFAKSKVWSESSLGGFFIAKDAKFLHQNNDDFD